MPNFLFSLVLDITVVGSFLPFFSFNFPLLFWLLIASIVFVPLLLYRKIRFWVTINILHWLVMSSCCWTSLFLVVGGGQDGDVNWMGGWISSAVKLVTLPTKPPNSFHTIHLWPECNNVMRRRVAVLINQLWIAKWLLKQSTFIIH